VDNKKVRAGREQLGAIAPKFAELNDEVLFGQVWSREEELSARDRSLVTIVSLIAGGNFEQLKFHLQKGKDNGLSKQEIAEIITHQAFYSGWPKAWSAFSIAKVVYGEGDEKRAFSPLFPLGEKNEAFAKYFIGQSYLKMLVPLDNNVDVSVANVSFEPSCHNNWHVHQNGYQILLVTDGLGWYQEWGKAAQQLKAGDVVNIPANVKHWHGAAKNSWFAHIAITKGITEWHEPVLDEEYNEPNIQREKI
jgi:alkylhydroperoxidase/carboxymuconolactone decarboxylase family protein YurZ/quercetin dioxygenase-like cupin family protein